MNKIKMIVYYLIIAKLPHSRYISFFNVMRMFYLSKVLKVTQFDKRSKFENNIYISDGQNVKIGKYVRINENVFLQGRVIIGDYVMIAPNVSIYSTTHNHMQRDIPMVLQGVKESEVIIGDDVWIGRNVMILPGVKINNGAIIGANSVVTRDVDSYTIVGGVPARVIKKRD